MSRYTFGLQVPHRFSCDMENFCKNNKIDYTYHAGLIEPSVSGDVEYLFNTDEGRVKAAEFVKRKKQIEFKG